MKIKTRKQREKIYNELYGNISTDSYTRLKNYLGEDFNEDLLQASLERINQAKKELKYYMINFTFYEEPIQTHRPRVNYHNHMMHVPNAKDRHKDNSNSNESNINCIFSYA